MFAFGRRHGEQYGTFTPNSKLYDVERQRFISGAERLAGHGFDIDWLIAQRTKEGEKCSDHFFSQLAGNSFAGNVYAAVLVSLLAFLPAAAGLRDESEEDVNMDEISAVLGIG